MEIVSKVFFVLLILVAGSFLAGFIDTWWEQRKREKNKRG